MGARRKFVFSRKELICMAVPLALVVAFRFRPTALVEFPLGVRILHALGRTGACTEEKAIAAWSDASQLATVRSRIQAALTLIEQDGPLTHWRTIDGNYWAPKGTDLPWVLAESLSDVYGSSRHNVQQGDVVLDCGANVGVFVRHALHRGAKTVVAVEPSPLNVECLRRNFAEEIARGQVIVYPKGVWNTDSQLPMVVYDNSVLDSFVMSNRTENGGKPSRQVMLPLTTIDKLVKELGLTRVDFIKMDVEGAEREALDGGAATIAAFKPRMSIATENLPDDQYVAPQVIKKLNGSYRHECGHCVVENIYSIQPDVMFFY